jgi:hypothetical protein
MNEAFRLPLVALSANQARYVMRPLYVHKAEIHEGCEWLLTSSAGPSTNQSLH